MNTHAQVSRVVTQVGTPSQKFGSSQSVLGIPTVVLQVTFCTGMQIHYSPWQAHLNVGGLWLQSYFCRNGVLTEWHVAKVCEKDRSKLGYDTG